MNKELNPAVETPTAGAAEAEVQETSAVQADISTASTAHPNVIRMQNAYLQVIDNPEFYTSESRVNKFLESCKLPDPTLKLWNSSLTHARKQLNDNAMELARETGSPVVMPDEQQINTLAIDKFRESWKKVGKGKPMPTVPPAI